MKEQGKVTINGLKAWSLQVQAKPIENHIHTQRDYKKLLIGCKNFTRLFQHQLLFTMTWELTRKQILLYSREYPRYKPKIGLRTKKYKFQFIFGWRGPTSGPQRKRDSTHRNGESHKRGGLTVPEKGPTHTKSVSKLNKLCRIWNWDEGITCFKKSSVVEYPPKKPSQLEISKP